MSWEENRKKLNFEKQIFLFLQIWFIIKAQNVIKIIYNSDENNFDNFVGKNIPEYVSVYKYMIKGLIVSYGKSYDR